MPTHESQLVAEARRLARAQERRRKLRRDLRVVDQEIKAARKSLRALVAPTVEPDDQLPVRNVEIMLKRNLG